MNRYLAGIVAFTFIVLSAAACQKAAKPLPEVRIGHAPHDHHAPLYVAAQKESYFKEHGGIFLKEVIFRKQYELIANGRPMAHISIDSSVGGQKLIRRLVEGHFELVLGGFPAMLTYIDQGEPIKILAPIMTEGAGLVLAEDLPVHNWQEFVSLLGKRTEPLRIGYKMDFSVQSLIFEQAMKEAGITFTTDARDNKAKVQLVNLFGAKNLIPALKNGLIDGFVIMQPFVAIAETQGIGRLVTLLHDMPPKGKWAGYPCCALAGTEKFIRSRPAVADAIAVLMLRANRYICEHPEESAALISKWLETPLEVEVKSLPTICFTTDMDQSWHGGVATWTKSMLEDGLLTGKVKEAYQAGTLTETIYDLDLYDRVRREK